MASTLTATEATDQRGLIGTPPDRFWHRSTPQAIAGRCVAGHDGEGWVLWTRHLGSRRIPRPLSRLVQGTTWPLLWCLPEAAEGHEATDLVRRLAALHEKQAGGDTDWQAAVDQWLAAPPAARSDGAAALAAVALAHSLHELANRVSATSWWHLFDGLVETAQDVRPLEAADDPVVGQLLAGELPLSLAFLFPEVTVCRRLKKPARRFLSTSLVDLLDGEGMPRAKHLPQLRTLLACWTRCRAIGATMKQSVWKEDAETQYQWLTTQALRLSRRDGSQMFSSAAAGRWNPGFLATAVQLGGDPENRAAAEKVFPRLAHDRRSRRRSNGELPDPAVHSEWGGLALLRPDWSRSGQRLAVTYDGPVVELELDLGKTPALLGTWGFQVTADGQPLAPTTDWEELCWVSDDDIDYLELEIGLEGGVRLQRQLALAREDHILYLADCILGSEQQTLEYVGTLPLGADVRFRGADQTREGFLVGPGLLARVVPPALPEWRDDHRHGSLYPADRCLKLGMHTNARNLCCPLFLDLNPRRLKKPCTWRQLTVSESLQIQSADVAVGYRVQCGHSQWLIYRALAARANRTFLGQNVSTDYLLARFHRDREIESLVEIE